LFSCQLGKTSNISLHLRAVAARDDHDCPRAPPQLSPAIRSDPLMPRPHSPPARPAAALLDSSVPASAACELPYTTEAPPAPRFVLNARQGSLSAEGVAAALPAGDVESLPARVKAFFAAQPPGPGLLVGVLPFDRTQHDHLFQPETVQGQDDGPVLTTSAEP